MRGRAAVSSSPRLSSTDGPGALVIRGFVHQELETSDLDPIAGAKLPPAAGLDLSIDPHRAALDEDLGSAAGAGDPFPFEELIQLHGRSQDTPGPDSGYQGASAAQGWPSLPIDSGPEANYYYDIVIYEIGDHPKTRDPRDPIGSPIRTRQGQRP